MAPKHLPSLDDWLTRQRPDSTRRQARGSTLPSLDDYLARPAVAPHEWPEGDPHLPPEPEPEAPRSFFAERFPKTRQALYGVVDTGLRLGEGLAQNAANLLPGRDPFQRASDFIERQRLGMEERTAPTTTGEMLARVGGNLVGEGAQYMAMGSAGRKLAGPVVQKIGERIAPRLTAKVAASRGILSEAAKDAAAVAPIDLAVTAVGPENSTLGAIAALTKSRYDDNDQRLRARMVRGLSSVTEAAAANPVTRFAGEVLIGGSADAAIRYAGREAVGAGIGAYLAPEGERVKGAALGAAAVAGGRRFLRGAPAPAPRATPMPPVDIPDVPPEMAARVAEAYGPGIARRKSPAEIAAQVDRKLRGPGSARQPTPDAVPEPVVELPSAEIRTTLAGPEPVIAPRTVAAAVPDIPPARMEPEPVAPVRAAEVPEPELEGPTWFEPTVKGKSEYADLSDADLLEKWRTYQRGLGRALHDAEISDIKDVKRDFNTWGEVITGMDSSAKGDWGRKARGRRTQAKARVAAVEREIQRRGLDTKSVDPYLDVKRSEIFPENADVLDLRQAPDDKLSEEIQRTVERYFEKREDPFLSERMALLYAEAKRAGRNIPDDVWTGEGGSVLPEIPGIIARLGIGATAGAVVAPEDQKGMGALAGAAALGVGPAALKRLAGPGVVKGASRFASDPNVAAVRAMRQRAAPSTASFLDRLKADKTRPLRRLRQGVTRAVAGLERYGEIVGGTDELARVAAKGRGWLPSSEMYAVENLTPVVRKVEKAGREDVSDLLIAERDIELRANGYGQKTPVTDAQLQAAVQRLSAVPEVRAAADEVRAYFRKLLEAKRDNGVITPQQFQEITDRGQHYVPFVRDMEDRIAQAGGVTKYNRSTGVRKMKKEDVVADLAIMDPLEMALLDTHETTRRIHKARVTNLVAKIAEQNPTEAAAFLRELPPVEISRVTQPPSAQASLPGMAAPTTKKKVTVRRMSGPEPSPGGVVIDPIVNGERRYYEVVDEELADAFASLTPTGQTALVSVLSSVAGVMRAGVVLHPAFAVANAMRDLGFTALSRELPGGTKRAAASAAVGAGVGAASSEDPLGGALLGATVAVLPFGGLHLARLAAENTSAMKDIIGPNATGAVLGGTAGALSADDEGESATLRFIGGALAGGLAGKAAGKAGWKKTGAYERFMAEGGGQFGFFGNRGEKDAAKLVGRMAEGGDVLQPRSIGELVNWISHAVETAPRLAYYKRTGDIAGARDLSLDFAVRGSSRSVGGLTKSTAFLNPALQGVDKWTRLLGKKNTYAVGLATMTAPAIALYEINKDNPEYQNIPLYQKALYYHIPKPDGGFFKVPKPFEPGALFGTAPEMARSFADTGDKESLKATGTVLARQYGPESFLPIPTAIAGPFEAFVNYDMFRRRSIDPNPWSDIDPAYQYDERTSTIALALNKVPGLGGVSPARIDHVLQSLTGTLGRDVADKITEAARVAGLDERREPAGRALQVMSRFHSSEGGVGEIEIAWRRKLDKGGRAYNTVKKLINDGQEAEAKKYLADNREAVAEYLRYKDVDKFLTLVSKTRGTIYDSDADREEKTRLLGNLNRAVAEMLRSPTAKDPTARLAGASK